MKLETDPFRRWISIVSRVEKNHDGFRTLVAAINAAHSGDRSELVESFRKFLETKRPPGRIVAGDEQQLVMPHAGKIAQTEGSAQPADLEISGLMKISG